MKKGSNKTDIRPYTRQFFRGNFGYMLLILIEIILMVGLNLVVSWILQQITDVISGIDTGFSLLALLLISIASVLAIGVCGILQYIAIPTFVTRGISRYKEYVFSELTKR